MFIIPLIVNIFKLDPIEHKLAIEGALKFLQAQQYLYSNAKLLAISEIWPAILNIQNTEEISIISLLDQLLKKSETRFCSLREIQPLSKSCYQSIVDFCYVTEVPDSQSYQKRVSVVQNVNKTTGKRCDDILDRLVDILQTNKL